MHITIRDNFRSAVGSVWDDGTIRDRFNMQMGHVDENGVVYDRFGLKNGSVSAEGMIYSRTGQRLGYLELDTGKVRAMTGLKVGEIKDIDSVNVIHAAAGALVVLLLRLYDKRRTLTDG
jgi:hypothetical protein